MGSYFSLQTQTVSTSPLTKESTPDYGIRQANARNTFMDEDPRSPRRNRTPISRKSSVSGGHQRSQTLSPVGSQLSYATEDS
jgi:hypothetical protein